MAVGTSVFTLTWENNKEMKLTRSQDGGTAITILNVEENGSWHDWSSIATIMNNCFSRKVADIGTAMAS